MTDKRPFPLPTGYFAIPLGFRCFVFSLAAYGRYALFSRDVSDIIGVTSVYSMGTFRLTLYL